MSTDITLPKTREGTGWRIAGLLRRGWPEYAAGAAAGLGSLATPMGHDEAFWLAIARMVLGGRTLYETAIDNKTPLVYAVTWLLDILPGPFVLARSLAVAVLVGGVARNLSRLMETSTPSGHLAAAVGGLWLVLLSQFHLTVEMVVLVLLVSSLKTRRSATAALLGLAAVAFDPRTVLLIPALMLYRIDQRRDGVRTLAAILSAGLITAVAVFLASEGMRRALLSATSRPYDLIAQLGVAAFANLPILALLVGGYRPRFGLVSTAWLAGGASIGLLSKAPFDHYWIYSIPLIILWLAPTGVNIRPFTMVVVILAFLPMAYDVYLRAEIHESFLDDSAAAVSIIRDRISGSEQILYMGGLPWLALEFPNAVMLRSPTSAYLTANTSKRSTYLDEIAEMVKLARIFAFDWREGMGLVEQADIDLAFPCAIRLNYIEVRFRADQCDLDRSPP